MNFLWKTAGPDRTVLSRKDRRSWYAAAMLTVALGLAACGDATGPLPQQGAPDELEFSLGGFGTGSSIVELRGDTVLLLRVPWDPRESAIDSVRAVPDPDAWRAFWRAAEQAGVRQWRRRYMAEGVLDGTGWGLHLVAGGRRIESEGSNAYPDRRGREHELDMTSDFRILLSALGELVGEPL